MVAYFKPADDTEKFGELKSACAQSAAGTMFGSQGIVLHVPNLQMREGPRESKRTHANDLHLACVAMNMEELWQLVPQLHRTPDNLFALHDSDRHHGMVYLDAARGKEPRL